MPDLVTAYGRCEGRGICRMTHFYEARKTDRGPANFLEAPKAEVHRILLPRTRVNRGAGGLISS